MYRNNYTTVLLLLCLTVSLALCSAFALPAEASAALDTTATTPIAEHHKPTIWDAKHALIDAIARIEKIDTDVRGIPMRAAVTEWHLRMISEDRNHVVTSFNHATETLKAYGRLSESDVQAMKDAQTDLVRTIFNTGHGIVSKRDNFAWYNHDNDQGHSGDPNHPPYGIVFAQDTLAMIASSAGGGGWTTECFSQYPGAWKGSIYGMARDIGLGITRYSQQLVSGE